MKTKSITGVTSVKLRIYFS